MTLKLSRFCEKCVFLPAAHFGYMKDLDRTDALMTISHHVKKTLDAGLKSYIIQLDFNAAFYRASHSSHLFKLKSIGEGRRVPSQSQAKSPGWWCHYSECIHIVSCVPQGRVLGPLLFILYTREMFELMENRLFVYADDLILMAVVRKPATTPAVVASLNRDSTGIHAGVV